MQDPSGAKKRLKLWLSMLRTTRNVEYVLRDRLKSEFDTTLPRFDVMAALFRSDEGMSMTRLSEQLVVSNGNVTGIVDRLEQEGQVQRVTNERDRRATLVALTDLGRAEFAKMAAAHQRWIDEMLTPLAADDIGRMTDMFQVLRDGMQSSGMDRQRKTKSKD
ncbi:MAG: MarR family transcriptional regulator [Alphaproteobacteria bacterium]|nr:MarR family transcriptional regulator [Alphaproteobacteria bacterium]MBO6864792.1 MarR family transcriptional regulator [Alphaproteobacteria bacterium]